jgi:D-3-phosphoglycerate dehydrogenase
MKIAVLDDYQDSVRQLDCFRLLDGHEVKIFTNSARGLGQLAVRLADYDALVLIRERTRLPEALLRKLPRLKLISQTGKAGPHIDLAAATALGIAVVEGAGDPVAPAEMTWALIMAAMRHIVPYASELKAGVWQSTSATPEQNVLGRTLHGKTLGIWGYGKIGGMIAGYGKAFGMKVLVWGREPSRIKAQQDGFQAAATKEAFFAAADVLSVHLRLNDATRGCVTASDLACMKTDALFVNTSRAELVESGALQAALQAGHPGRAALDVFEEEPLPADSPWPRMPNVLATPHLGYVEKNSYELYLGAAFRNIVDFANGTPKNVVNPEALQARS